MVKVEVGRKWFFNHLLSLLTRLGVVQSVHPDKVQTERCGNEGTRCGDDSSEVMEVEAPGNEAL